MTNEELAVLAKTDKEALAKLWEQNDGLAAHFANQRYIQLEAGGNMRGVTMDDLKQAAFLGMVRAVGYFDPEKGFSFNSYWSNCVKSEFNSLLGLRTSKRDPLDTSVSLDVPLTDEKDAGAFVDFLPDPNDAFEEYAEKDEKLTRAEMLQKSIKKLSEDQQRVLQLIFYKNMTKVRTASIMGISQHTVDTLEHTAIFALRRSLRGMFQ